MNGCCYAHIECRWHDLDCPMYWPCGCPKQNERHHSHTFRRPIEIKWTMPDWETSGSRARSFDTYNYGVDDEDGGGDSRSDLMPTILDDAD
jgi:hypothetical protein